MKRKNIQHIKLAESQKSKVESSEEENFLTAEGIELKKIYSLIILATLLRHWQDHTNYS